MAIKLVIDTNVLVSSLSSKSIYHKLIECILNEDVTVFVTDEIILEYEEILKQKYSLLVADNFIAALKELPNVYFVTVYYKWHFLRDNDDNKFVDCFVASGANFLVTNDKGFNILNTINFPKVNLLKIENLLEII